MGYCCRVDKAGIVPTAMMDISDGPLRIIAHLQSHGAAVYMKTGYRIDYQTAATAEEFNMNLVTAALNGGEDYELLTVLYPKKHDIVAAIPGVSDRTYYKTRIGLLHDNP